MNKRLLALALGILSAVARAEVPFQPFPVPQVTLEQWTSYHSTVRAELSATAQERAAEQVTMYFDDASRTQYIFTLPSNPAHPAWVARRIVSRPEQGFYVEQVGYFAGSQQLFESWFAAFQRENEQLRQPQ